MTVITAVREFKKEANEAKKTRMRRNRVNRGAYLGVQNWEHKQKGQSQEFLPKTAVAVEQFVAFTKRALTQFGDWFQVELSRDSRSPLSEPQIAKFLTCFLDNLLTNDNQISSFATVLGDGLKVGALESLVVFKVHGHSVLERSFESAPGALSFDMQSGLSQGPATLQQSENRPWKLRIDLVRLEDYYPDPTGRGLYEIHEIETDLHTLKQRAEDGIYSKEAVAQIESSFEPKEKEQARAAAINQNTTQSPSFRKKVTLTEFWGTLLDEKGNVVHENVVCTIANDQFLIRSPIANPFWHGESPFVASPLIRVPFSVWHKALMDHAVQINLAQNELFNLILDGGMASVWGIKQLRAEDLEDPSQVQEGIPQGETLLVKSTLPHGQKVLEQVTEGQVPPDAQITFELLNREFTMAALSNELKLGSLPAKQVKATEITELSASQAVTIDAISADIERDVIQKVLRKAWLTILQNVNDVSSDQVVSSLGLRGTFVLSQMTEEERFTIFAPHCSFKVHGLSQVLAKVRDFQKLMALLQSVVQNPIMLQAFFQKYSPGKLLSTMMKTLNVNPVNMERDEQEMQRIDQDLAGLEQFKELTSKRGGGSGTGTGRGAGVSGEGSGPAQINAASNPTSSLAGIGNT
tara:strand:- start:236 stop:2143 length:1908 start_codon:yes stop_codon:yes gene_type:complete